MIAEKDTPVDHPEYNPQAGPTPGINIGNPTERLFRNIPKESISAIVSLNSLKIIKDSSSSRIVKVPIRNDAVKRPAKIKNKIILTETEIFIIATSHQHPSIKPEEFHL